MIFVEDENQNNPRRCVLFRDAGRKATSDKTCYESDDDSGGNAGNPENWQVPGDGSGVKKENCHQNLPNVVSDSSGSADTYCAEFAGLFKNYHKNCAEHAACDGKGKAHGVTKKKGHQNNTNNIDKHGAL